MFRISYWVFPIISALVWLGMLLGLLIYWTVDTHETHYVSMTDDQHIAYISDIGASELQPLFIAGCCVTTVFLDLSFLSDRWLRHRGRLVPNTTTTEKILSGLTIVFAIAGTAGLILLSIFDTVRHPKLHDGFLLLFIAGYIISAIFICWEYQRLGIKYREHAVLRRSFWMKLSFIIVEVLLAIAFAVCTFTSNTNPGAILEWIIAFVFTFYVLSFYLDLYPAVRTRHTTALALDAKQHNGVNGHHHNGQRQMEEGVGGDGHVMTQIPPTHSTEHNHYHHHPNGAVPSNY